MAARIPVIVALTGEARHALSGAAELELTHFPFRVGRESRHPRRAGLEVEDERRGSVVPPTNDLYIWDPGPLLNVSREHFQIERDEHGEYFVRDRGSTCGTLVGSLRLGLGGPESCAIYPDDMIIVGTPNSPFVFRFELAEERADSLSEKSRNTRSAREKAQDAWNLSPADTQDL